MFILWQKKGSWIRTHFYFTEQSHLTHSYSKQPTCNRAHSSRKRGKKFSWTCRCHIHTHTQKYAHTMNHKSNNQHEHAPVLRIHACGRGCVLSWVVAVSTLTGNLDSCPCVCAHAYVHTHMCGSPRGIMTLHHLLISQLSHLINMPTLLFSVRLSCLLCHHVFDKR